MWWWQMDQGRRTAEDAKWKEIPALPITATKVALFLAYETTREKKKRNSSETLRGTTVGKSQVLQVISALENYRLNHQHEYPDHREALVKLRDDTHVWKFESAAKHTLQTWSNITALYIIRLYMPSIFHMSLGNVQNIWGLDMLSILANIPSICLQYPEV
ncbi:hypothetical protein DFH09DRAFT_1084136 [Mycena vulgaris]|nr:hypothetical protein DFH09DRAFT_1084136 [Mycena vulgaris]